LLGQHVDAVEGSKTPQRGAGRDVETVFLPVEVAAQGRKKSSKLAILSRRSLVVATVR